jgi:hypothetical protein
VTGLLRITPNQYSAFAHAERLKFVQTLAIHLSSLYPEVAAANFPSSLEPICGALLAQAESYGIRLEADVVRFGELCCEAGTGFPHRPQDDSALRILTGDFSPAYKLDKTEEFVLAVELAPEG